MKEKAEDKKILVLEAALDLISKNGFYGTPMSQIAKKANIAVGTIYLYFPNKENLINNLYIHIKNDLANCILKNYSKNLLTKENFLLVLSNIFNYFMEHPKEFLFMEQYSTSSLITCDTRNESMDIFTEIRVLFENARESNLLKNLPLEILAAIINGAILSLVKLYLFSNIEVNNTVVNKSLEAIWDAIKK